MNELQTEAVNIEPAPIQWTGFVKAFLIVDLVFCIMRFMTVPLTASTFFFDDFILSPLIVSLELLYNLSIGVIGSWANIGLLCKKEYALKLAYFSIFLTITLGFFVTFLESYILSQAYEGAALIGFLVGNISVIAIRVVLLIFYIIAIYKATKIVQNAKLQG